MNDSTYRVSEVTAGHERGWSFTPLSGKRPVLTGWQSRERETIDDAVGWAGQGNIGLRTGSISGVVVIDLDPGADVTGLNLPPTVTVLTGREGGRHLYYTANGTQIGNSSGKLAPHVDVKGENGQVVFPGSIHPDTGKMYQWAPGCSPTEIGLASLPLSILNKLKDKPAAPSNGTPQRVSLNYGTAALEGEVNTIRSAPEGQRNEALNVAAHKLGSLVAGGALDREHVRTALHDVALEAGLDEHEIGPTIESGLSSGEKNPRVVHAGNSTLKSTARLNTDVGNAARFAIRERERMRFCYTRSLWLIWDGRRWAPDDTGESVTRAKRTALSIFDEAKRAEGTAAEELGKWAVKSQRRERLSAMLELAKPDLAVRASELDADPWLLTCSNGTIDLRTGELREHRADDYITRLAPVEYQPEAESDDWTRFLDTATAGDAEIRAFIQRAAGYSATGLTSEERFFFVHGPGATGKSTFIEAVKNVLGDYATTADFETFLENRNTGPRNDVAALDGARLVASVEVSDGRRLAQGLVKMLTGGDTIRARFLYREGFEFTPRFTLWLVANHAPQVDDLDDALWRRIVRIPFEHVIPESERDPELKARLKSNLVIQAAILRWVVDGCLNWREVGLDVPETIKRATDSYREEQNPLGEFLETHCILGPGYEADSGDLRAAYLQYAEEQGIKKPMLPQQWYERLRILGCESDRRTAGRRVWCGIGIVNSSR